MKEHIVLYFPDKSGACRYDHMLQFKRQTGRFPSTWKEPAPPKELRHLWEWFWEVRNTIGGSGFGPNPMNYGDLINWGTAMDIQLLPFETKALLAMDRAYLVQMEKRSK